MNNAPDEAQVADQSDSPECRKKTWRAGTLVYTGGGLAALFFWLLCGDFAWSMRDRSATPMAQWYLDHLQVSSLLFGLLISSFPALIALILGPIISVKSDRHRGRYGRRIPFLLVTTPIAAGGMIGLGLTPLIAEWVHGHFPQQNSVVVAVICFGIFWAAFEFATIAGQSVFGGLINDVVPREWLGRFFGLFRAVALLDGIIFNYWIIGHVPNHYMMIFIVIGVFYGTSFFWVCLKVKEGQYPPPPPAPVSQSLAAGFLRGTGSYLRECFANRYYLTIFFMSMVSALAFAPVNTFSIPYATSLGMGLTVYGKCMVVTFAASFSLSFFLGWMADVFHPLRVVMVSLAGYALVTTWGGNFAHTPQTFAVALVLHGILAGCYFTGSASLAQRLFPHSKFAQFNSAANIFMSLGNILLAPLVGTLIDLSGKAYHYTFVIGGVIALFALAATWLVYRKFCQLGGPKNYVAPE